MALGVDSASNRNENQEYLLRVKAAGAWVCFFTRRGECGRLRHCAASRKVAGAIPVGVIGTFY